MAPPPEQLASAQTAPAALRLGALRLPALELRGRGLLARAALAGMVVCGFLMAAGAAARNYGPELRLDGGLPSSIRGPLEQLGPQISGTDFVLLFVGVSVCYLAVLALAGSVSTRAGLAAIVAVHLAFALAPPLLSSDVFNYLGYARLEVVHGLNPYLHPLVVAPLDPSFAFIGWPLQTTAYGPLFTLATMPLALLGFAASLWLFKAVVAAASLGCVALVWRCAERLGREPLPAALYFGLNPVVLVFGVGGAHNEALMMLAALGGVYLLLAGREAGAAAIAGAAAVKLSAAVLLPFAALGSRRPARMLLWTIAATAVAAAVSLLAFGTHAASFIGVLGETRELASPNDVPGLLNDLLGLGLATATLGTAGGVVLTVTLAALLVRVHRGGDWLENAAWATLATIVTTTWLLPWYLIWFLPLAALARAPYQRLAGLALTALVIAPLLPPLTGS
jgi:hypothetical protein